jgi:alkylhydroperoxidase family enzyme
VSAAALLSRRACLCQNPCSMSWLPEQSAGTTALERALGLRPELLVDLKRFHALFWQDGRVDPIVLELCRLRIAGLLRCASELRARYEPARRAGLTEAKIAALPSWPKAPDFTARERACLAFAEAFVVDVHSIDDELAAAVAEHLSPAAMVAFTEALAVFDGFARFRLVLGLEPPSSAIAVDPSVEAALP